ncbi:inovirus-type Gp2 protein [Pseudomonas sp. NPDC007930]|uniref:YagK/YfjJ domain-containing protein n=1 Tax=Pseudomonas sp. NPDC007930 TaxID=3364417 RepID=UPI0036EB0325
MPDLHEPLAVFTFSEIVSGVLRYAMGDHRRILVVRVDLNYPMRTIGNAPFDNSFMRKFLKLLRSRIYALARRMNRKFSRERVTRARAVWIRNLRSQDGRQHVHLVLMVNRDVFRTLSRPDLDGENLSRCIQQAWTSLLGVDVNNHPSLVRLLIDRSNEIINGHGAQQFMNDMLDLRMMSLNAWSESVDVGYSLAEEDLLTHRCSIQCVH